MKWFLIIFGFSSGVVVGSGVVAILILVGIVPKLARISNTIKFIYLYEYLLVLGSFLGSLIYIHNFRFNIGPIGVVISGLAYGVFVGFLSSGLAEILDYIPVISRRLSIPAKYLKYIIFSLLIGKVIGSFLGWTII